jgi:holo-[acyl-carrier protein] synthase
MIHGVGVDIIEIARVEKAIARWGRRFLEHIFTEEEIAYSQRHARPAQHFAARFAAKEAVFKAVGDDPRLAWKDIVISNDPQGKPRCGIVRGNLNRTVHLSLSHGKDYAVASAVITAGP